MTRKDYVRLANALRRAHEDKSVDPQSVAAIAVEIAKELKRGNAQFDAEWFVDAVTYAMRV